MALAALEATVVGTAMPTVIATLGGLAHYSWVFYLNLPFGVLGAVVIALPYPATHPASARMDWMGAALLFSGVTALLIALGGATTAVVPWLAAAAMLLPIFVLVERRTADPILPLDLFRLHLVSGSLAVVFMTGMAMFGAIAFVPLFVQGVMGGTATQAWQVLTPLFLGWVGMSVVGARLTARIEYRIVAAAGNTLLLAGFVGLATIGADASMAALYAAVFLLGCGMGLSMLSLLLAVQHGVERSQLGLATSLNEFAHALARVFGAGGVMSAIGLAASFALPPVDFARDAVLGDPGAAAPADDVRDAT